MKAYHGDHSCNMTGKIGKDKKDIYIYYTYTWHAYIYIYIYVYVWVQSLSCNIDDHGYSEVPIEHSHGQLPYLLTR